MYVNFSGANQGKFRGDDGYSTTPFASLVDGAVVKSAPNAQNLVLVELNLPA